MAEAIGIAFVVIAAALVAFLIVGFACGLGMGGDDRDW